MEKNKIFKIICKKVKIWYNKCKACCNDMKNNIKHLELTLILIIFVGFFACRIVAKEHKEGRLYHTSLGPPQLASQKPSIELLKPSSEQVQKSIHNKEHKNQTIRQRRKLQKTANEESDKKTNKTRINSSSVNKKRNSLKVRKQKKIDFKDKNGDGYDDRHKANDL